MNKEEAIHALLCVATLPKHKRMGMYKDMLTAFSIDQESSIETARALMLNVPNIELVLVGAGMFRDPLTGLDTSEFEVNTNKDFGEQLKDIYLHMNAVIGVDMMSAKFDEYKYREQISETYWRLTGYCTKTLKSREQVGMACCMLRGMTEPYLPGRRGNMS
jgi:hypothetical protein